MPRKGCQSGLPCVLEKLAPAEVVEREPWKYEDPQRENCCEYRTAAKEASIAILLMQHKK